MEELVAAVWPENDHQVILMLCFERGVIGNLNTVTEPAIFLNRVTSVKAQFVAVAEIVL